MKLEYIEYNGGLKAEIEINGETVTCFCKGAKNAASADRAIMSGLYNESISDAPGKPWDGQLQRNYVNTYTGRELDLTKSTARERVQREPVAADEPVIN